MKASKTEGAIAAPEYKPSMHVDGAQARALTKLPIGTKVQTTAHGRLAHAAASKYDGKTHHSATIEFDKVRHSAAGKKGRGARSRW